MIKVSIIIPTLNRAHLLKSALKSAIEQDYKDLEIVVCDDYSDDNTKEVAESFDSKNIVYVRTDKRLNMSDTFEFSLNKAKGEYLTFLTDTCYLLPNCISTAVEELAKSKVKLIMWRNCVYCHPDWFEIGRRNTLQIPSFTFKTYLIDSKIALKELYSNIYDRTIPKSINSLCHKSVIQEAIKIQGRFFSYPTPDRTSAVSMLANTSSFALIDKPLFIGSISTANIGASQSFNLGKSAQNFLKGFKEKKMEEIAFWGIYTTSALNIKSLENAGKFYPGICPAIDIKNAVAEIAESLVKLETYGTDVSNYWKMLYNNIISRREKLGKTILKRKIKSIAKWKIVKLIRSVPCLYRLESLVRKTRILKGDKYKFNDIEGCAKLIADKGYAK